jgi:hypothetical protein
MRLKSNAFSAEPRRLLPREPTEDFCSISGAFNVSKEASPVRLHDEAGLTP